MVESPKRRVPQNTPRKSTQKGPKNERPQNKGPRKFKIGPLNERGEAPKRGYQNAKGAQNWRPISLKGKRWKMNTHPQGKTP